MIPKTIAIKVCAVWTAKANRSADWTPIPIPTKPSFIILLDTPRAYSDYSINQNRIIPPGTSLDKIQHDSKLDPNTISVDLVLSKVKKFI